MPMMPLVLVAPAHRQGGSDRVSSNPSAPIAEPPQLPTPVP